MGYVYLICDMDRPNTYKIGVTNKDKVELRKKELQTGNASELHICNSFKTKAPFLMEKYLHRVFNSKRIHGEWFNLTDEDVMSFVEECSKYEDALESLQDNPFFKEFK